MSELELRGGWRMLCAAALHDAVSILAAGRNVDEKRIISHWIKRGDVGEVTFLDCCEVLAYDPDILREKLRAIRGKPIRKPYGRAVPVRQASVCPR